MFTEDGKICSPFAEQFHVFHQGKVKEKENRAGAHGEILNGCPKLSRRLARYHLAMALFQSPLAERSVTVSVSLRSPAVDPVAFGRQERCSATLALRISRTAWQLHLDHLCPFALWTTFSSSLVGRYSYDYYGHSVPVR